MSGQLQRVGKAVVHSPHIGESTAGVAHSESGIRFTPEKEQTCILLVRVCCFLFGSINVVKNCLSGLCPRLQRIDNIQCLVGINVAVKSQPQIPQGPAAPVTVVRGKQQTAVISKSRVVYDGLNRGICCKFRFHCSLSFRIIRAERRSR